MRAEIRAVRNAGLDPGLPPPLLHRLAVMSSLWGFSADDAREYSAALAAGDTNGHTRFVGRRVPSSSRMFPRAQAADQPRPWAQQSGAPAHIREATMSDQKHKKDRSDATVLTEAELDQVSGGHAVLLRDQVVEPGTSAKPRAIIIDEASKFVVPGVGPTEPR